MSWASRQTTEMPVRRAPPGRHRRRRSSILGVLAAALSLVVVVVGAMFAPSWLGWPPPSQRVAADPSTMATSAPPRPARTTTPPPPHDHPIAVPTADAGGDRYRRPRESGPGPDQRRAGQGGRLPAPSPGHQTAYRGPPAQCRHGEPRVLQPHGSNGSDPGDRLRAAGYRTDGGWAENIASGYGNPAAVMAGWMASPGHRANILNCSLRALGVGVARSDGGRLYWTQDFGGR